MTSAAAREPTAALTTEQPPSALLAMTELPRALADWTMLPLAAGLLATAPRGDGHPVLVLPGYVGTDHATAALRQFLTSRGYDAREWLLGPNLGEASVGPAGEKLAQRLSDIHQRAGEKVSLIGWSLGGIMARLLARRVPDAVRQVIMLGSPFAGSHRATSLWGAYEWITGRQPDDRTALEIDEAALPPPVPSTAIWSREDGVVAWQNCRESDGPLADNIEVRGSHLGLGVNPAVFYAIADRLAQPADGWVPFDRSGLRAMLFPRPERA